jgi:2-dehydropantoate 2-reductase
MKITVLGAGAMGSLFGGLLAEAGHAVELLDINEEHISRIIAHGLCLSTGAGTRVVPMRITRPKDAHVVPDWLIVFTKTIHTADALKSVGAILGKDTRVLSLQNGLGNAEKLSEFVHLSRVAIGVTTVPADLVAPGEVHSHGQGHIRMMMADGRTDAALLTLAEAMNAVGMDCHVDPTVSQGIWEKVAFNAAINSVCAVCECTVGELGAQAAARALAHSIASEVLVVASADGLKVSPDTVHGNLDHAMDHHLDHKPSMLQDMLASRQTEIDSINGHVLRIARLHSIHIPNVQALDTLVRLKALAVRKKYK